MKAGSAKKPAQTPQTPPVAGAVSRRWFFKTAWVALGLAAAAELIWVAASFLRPAGRRSEGPGASPVVHAGGIEAFSNGTVTAFQKGQFYLVRLGDGGFLALSCKCTHLGCTVPWIEAEKRFLCPCHASAFDVTGEVVSAPAPRPLDLFPVTIENNVVKVDTSRRVKRSRFSPEQPAYPPKP